MALRPKYEEIEQRKKELESEFGKAGIRGQFLRETRHFAENLVDIVRELFWCWMIA